MKLVGRFMLKKGSILILIFFVAVVAVEELMDLSQSGLKFTDFLEAKFQHHASHNQEHDGLGEKLSWDRAHRVDPEAGPIAP